MVIQYDDAHAAIMRKSEEVRQAIADMVLEVEKGIQEEFLNVGDDENKRRIGLISEKRAERIRSFVQISFPGIQPRLGTPVYKKLPDPTPEPENPFTGIDLSDLQSDLPNIDEEMRRLSIEMSSASGKRNPSLLKRMKELQERRKRILGQN